MILVLCNRVCSQTGNAINFSSPENPSFKFIRQIDSISKTKSKAQPFAFVYIKSMENISRQMQTMDSSIQNFVIRFEAAFADYFLDACIDFEKETLSQQSYWHCFFNAQQIPWWKRVLLGVNVHVNADIWQALVRKFSLEELKKFRKPFLSLQPSVAKVHSAVFDTVLAHSGYLRFINFITFQQDRKLGELILYRWRNRNINLAILYFEQPGKFNKKWKRVQRKKKKIDRIILRSGPKTSKYSISHHD